MVIDWASFCTYFILFIYLFIYFVCEKRVKFAIEGIKLRHKGRMVILEKFSYKYILLALINNQQKLSFKGYKKQQRLEQGWLKRKSGETILLVQI